MRKDSPGLIDFAREAADVKTRMVESFESGFGAAHCNLLLGTNHGDSKDKPDADAGVELAAASATTWKAAESFVVAPAMTAIIAAAAQALPTGGITLTPTVLPAPIGVVHFPEPVYMRATKGDLCPTTAITWSHIAAPGASNGQLLRGSYTDTDSTSVAERVTRFHAAQSQYRIGPRLLAFYEVNRYHETLTPHRRSPDAERDWQAADDGRIVIDTATYHLPLLSVVYSFWVISQQKLATATPARPPRGVRRRAERASIKHTTRVVSLRRTTTPTDPNKPPQWHYQVRFVVRGHWRRLASGDYTWVHIPFKGPPDAPLLGGEKIHLLHR